MSTQTFQYACGHSITVKTDGRKFGGGTRACRMAQEVRAGRKCHRCRREQALRTLRAHEADDVVTALLDCAPTRVLEDVILEIEEAAQRD